MNGTVELNALTLPASILTLKLSCRVVADLLPNRHSKLQKKNIFSFASPLRAPAAPYYDVITMLGSNFPLDMVATITLNKQTANYPTDMKP